MPASLWSGLACCGLILVSAVLTTAIAADFPLPGEWPCPRCNPSRDGRAQGKGNIHAAPKIIGKHFLGRCQTTLVVEPAREDSSLTAPPPASEALPNEATWRHRGWSAPEPKGLIEGKMQSLPITMDTTYADVFPEIPGLEKIWFQAGWGKGPGGTREDVSSGKCLAWKNGKWEQVWETEPIPMPFNMSPLVGDFDGDGKLEVGRKFGRLLDVHILQKILD